VSENTNGIEGKTPKIIIKIRGPEVKKAVGYDKRFTRKNDMPE